MNLNLFDQIVEPIRESKSTTNREEISLEDLAPGAYVVLVSGKANPDYTLVIDAPEIARKDWAENHAGLTDNDIKSHAHDLRRVDAPVLLSDLSIHSGDASADHDWFNFQLPTDGSPGQVVRAQYEKSDGELDVTLHKLNGERIAAVTIEGGKEISLAGLPAMDAQQQPSHIICKSPPRRRTPTTRSQSCLAWSSPETGRSSPDATPTTTVPTLRSICGICSKSRSSRHRDSVRT